MSFELHHRATINAPAPVVWTVVKDILQWPQLTPSITRIVPLDAETVRPGNKFSVQQPRMPEFVWEVIRIEPSKGWSWQQRTKTGTTTAHHDLIAIDASTTALHLRVVHAGLLRVMAGRLTQRQAERFLEQEAVGIRHESERWFSELSKPPSARSGAAPGQFRELHG